MPRMLTTPAPDASQLGSACAARGVKDALVSVRGLQKSYGDIRALKGVSFEVHAGEIFGVLGPNGAGKTTLVEILEGIREADGGDARVLNCDVKRGIRPIRDRIGIAMQKTALPMGVRVNELLHLYAVLYDRCSVGEELLERLGLSEKLHATVSSLSGGQLQRLALVLALLPKPKVLFLDEPTSDLDPQARRAVWDLLRDPQWTPGCILITTHQMDEAEQLCNKVAIIDDGELLTIATPTQLVERHAPERSIKFSVGEHISLPGLNVEYEAVGGKPQKAHIRTSDLQGSIRILLDLQRRFHFQLDDLQVERATLEDVFIALTGRTIRA